MIDPPRLRDDAGGSVGEMLSAARVDGPRDAAADKRRVLAALAALEGPGVPGAGARRNVDASRWSRWMFGALAGAGLVAIGAVATSSSSSNDAVAPSAPAAAPAPTTPSPATVDTNAPAEVPSVDVVDLPTAAPSASAGTSRRAELKAKDAPAPASVNDELAAVERVRSRLAGGDVKGARRELASYRANFAQGRFVEEIDALEIEALAADGERADARAKADAFAARYPSSPYARRVRSVVTSMDQAVTP